MASDARVRSGVRRTRAGRLGVALVALLALAAVSCGGDDNGLKQDGEGFHIEPAAEVGPHAFTPSVATADSQNAMGLAPDDGESAQGAGASPCDTAKFVKELQSRPDAYREWAKVMGLKPEQVPAYISGLKSAVLTKDTKVTNHGLKDGHAYPRQSVLTAGTAVLVDTGGATAPSTTSSSAPPATAPGGGVIVTRCKCGNPLLPPGDPKAEEEPASSEPPATATPGSVSPGSTPGTGAKPSTSSRPTTSAAKPSTTKAASGGTGPSTTAD